jgi:hypothetical protein
MPTGFISIPQPIILPTAYNRLNWQEKEDVF